MILYYARVGFSVVGSLSFLLDLVGKIRSYFLDMQLNYILYKLQFNLLIAGTLGKEGKVAKYEY